MFALILETLSSTELLFILVIALIFFGPRKLPQLARSMGKGLAEFRKASDDFKRTWEREVAMETAKLEMDSDHSIQTPEPHSYLEAKPTPEPLMASAEPLVESAEPLVATANPELVVARGSVTEPSSQSAEPLTATSDIKSPDPLRKQEWI